MSAFLITLTVACLVGFGGSDAILLAQLVATRGPRPALLVTAIATACSCAALAGWFGWEAALRLSALARAIVAGGIWICAGASLLRPVSMRGPKEPTHSLGAVAFVFFAFQILDAGRLATLAIALSGSAMAAAGGGALGSAAALTIGWRSGERAPGSTARMERRRRACGVLLILGTMIAATKTIVFGNH